MYCCCVFVALSPWNFPNDVPSCQCCEGAGTRVSCRIASGLEWRKAIFYSESTSIEIGATIISLVRCNFLLSAVGTGSWPVEIACPDNCTAPVVVDVMVYVLHPARWHTQPPTAAHTHADEGTASEHCSSISSRTYESFLRMRGFSCLLRSIMHIQISAGTIWGFSTPVGILFNTALLKVAKTVGLLHSKAWQPCKTLRTSHGTFFSSRWKNQMWKPPKFVLDLVENWHCIKGRTVEKYFQVMDTFCSKFQEDTRYRQSIFSCSLSHWKYIRWAHPYIYTHTHRLTPVYI